MGLNRLSILYTCMPDISPGTEVDLDLFEQGNPAVVLLDLKQMFHTDHSHVIITVKGHTCGNEWCLQKIIQQ
jgi:hypothetical protein